MIGIHVDSSLDYIINSITDAKKNGANIIQFFVTGEKDKYIKIRDFLEKNNMQCVIHASYTINLAQNWDEYNVSVQKLIDEINIAHVLKAKSIVVHLGKKLSITLEESINNMYTSMIYIHNKTKDVSHVKILLETSAGQKSELGYELNELARIYRKFSKHKNTDVSQRFGICFDTCHVFSAGYNFHNKEAIKIFFDNFDELIGIKEIKLVHLNDSKVESGKRVDRHANLGRGYIGKENLIIIAQLFKNIDIPLILETAYPTIFNDLKILLKNLI